MQEHLYGLVFNIQRFSLHDGPGIRTTVFLCGCPLRCPWCSNPESQSGNRELFYIQGRCIKCGLCSAVCPRRAITGTYNNSHVNRSVCVVCNVCSDICPTGALSVKGMCMHAEEVLATVLSDRFTYGTTGGLTLSGGEPFFQAGFTIALLKLTKQSSISTCIETTLETSWKHLEAALPFTDHFLVDFKHPNPAIHKKVMGVDSTRICSNLKMLLAAHSDVVVRIPLIPGFNTSQELLLESTVALRRLGAQRIQFLDYHTLGTSKYEHLNRKYCNSIETTDQVIIRNRAERLFRENGFSIIEED